MLGQDANPLKTISLLFISKGVKQAFFGLGPTWPNQCQSTCQPVPTSANQCQSTCQPVLVGTGWHVLWHWLACALALVGMCFETWHVLWHWLACALALVGTGWHVLWHWLALVGMCSGTGWHVLWHWLGPKHIPTSAKAHANQCQSTCQPVPKQRKGKT